MGFCMFSPCVCGFPLGAPVPPMIMKNMHIYSVPMTKNSDEDLDLVPQALWLQCRERISVHIMYMPPIISSQCPTDIRACQ